MKTKKGDAAEPPVAGPSLAVAMPVYNAMPFLDAAIESILGQTFQDFELCVYDDHSTDGSFACALGWQTRDSRIRVMRGDRRLGPVGSSNAAMAMTGADLLARMDADDVAHPERLAQQLAVLRSNPDAVMVGSTYRLIDAGGKLLSAETSDFRLFMPMPIGHPTIMIRRSAYDAAGGYRIGTDYFEDADLYSRLGATGACYVMRQPLVDVRMAGQHARLSDDPIKVLAQQDRYFVTPHARTPGKVRYSARAIRMLAELRVMDLQRPGLIRFMLSHGSFEQPRYAAQVFAIVCLAELSPRLTRGLLRTHWARRETRLSARLGDSQLFRWIPDAQWGADAMNAGGSTSPLMPMPALHRPPETACEATAHNV